MMFRRAAQFSYALTAAALLCLPQAAAAQGQTKAKAAHAHSHAHGHAHGADNKIERGYFDDAQVKPRKLADWQGDWQSVYPLLLRGSLDSVMAHKAEHGDKSQAEYRAYYETGYKTDVNRITIKGNDITFYRGDAAVRAHYVSDGHEILTYKKGNRGVRFIFKKSSGDAQAPQFIQFSDHQIAPTKVQHYHLYSGDDRAELLKEITNWPTYYPSSWSKIRIRKDMSAH